VSAAGPSNAKVSCWTFSALVVQLLARATRSKCSLNDFHDDVPLYGLGSCNCLTTTVGTVTVNVVVSAEQAVFVVVVVGGCTVVVSAGLIVVAAVAELVGLAVEIGTVSIVCIVVLVVTVLLDIVVTFNAGAICMLVDKCELTIALCVEYVGMVSAKAELIVCTVLSAIAEFVGTGAVRTDVECALVKKREPTVTVEVFCKGTKCPGMFAAGGCRRVVLAGCCKLASETL